MTKDSLTFLPVLLGYIFEIDCQTTLQVQEELISHLPVEFIYNYVVLVVAGYGAICPGTGQHRSSAKILILLCMGEVSLNTLTGIKYLSTECQKIE